MKLIDIQNRMKVVVTSQNWDRVEDYLESLRTLTVETLIHSTDIKQINKLQGKIEMLDQILSLPAKLK